MSPCEQGTLAFLITTFIFMGTTLYFVLKLDRVQRQLSQLQRKASQSEYYDKEQKKAKQG